MAEHAASDTHSGDMDAHRATYQNFITGSIAVSIICFFILVALVNFRFAQSFALFSGFAGLIVGVIVVAIGAKAGGKWLPSLVVLIVYGLLTAINI